MYLLRLSTKGLYVSLGAPGPYDGETVPERCNAGFFGNSTESMSQDSGSCAGSCPAGTYCPEQGTVTPLTCPAGSFCRKQAIAPVKCSAGYFSNQTGIRQ